jgi:hypothetical protein
MAATSSKRKKSESEVEESPKALKYVRSNNTDVYSYYVINRRGLREDISFDKITQRLVALCKDIKPEITDVIPALIVKAIASGVVNGMTTSAIDDLAAEEAASMSALAPEYGNLAGRICVSNLHKNTSDSLKVTFGSMMSDSDARYAFLSQETYDIFLKHEEVLQKAINYERDYNYDYFGFKTVERSYLYRDNVGGTGRIVERPQHMLMRVAIGVIGDDVERILETYELLSLKYYTHATPTLFNAGTRNAQMSSCFLLTMKEDSIEGIYDTLKRCALISKSAGGIGLDVTDIRASSSHIRGTNGVSNGLVPMLRVYNDTARYVDQGKFLFFFFKCFFINNNMIRRR